MQKLVISLLLPLPLMAGTLFDPVPSVQQTRRSPFYGPVKVGNLSNTYVEISGLATPKRAANKGYVWAIEDGANAHIIAFNSSTAAMAGVWTLTGASVSDVEECDSVMREGQPYVYLFDTGDNSSSRSTFKVFRIKEPTVTGSNGTLSAGTDYEEIVCQFPAGNPPSLKDVEGAFVDPLTGDAFFITKRITPILCYKLPWQSSYSGTQTLTYMGGISADATLNTISTTPSLNNGYCTGACISPNGTEILLRSYHLVARFTRNPNTQNCYQAMTGTPVFLPCATNDSGSGRYAVQTNAEPQGEAICFDPAGLNYYTASEYVTANGGTASHYPLFKFVRCPTSTTTWTFQEGSNGYSGTLDTYLDSNAAGTSQATATSLVADWDYSPYPTVSRTRQGLMKFDLSSIPSSSTVVGAYLDAYINNEGLGFRMHKMLVSWTESSTYTSLTSGVSLDGVEASATADAILGPTPVGQGWDTYTGAIHVNLPVAALQGWVANSATNYGWVFVGPDESTGDGLQIVTREEVTSTKRPKLVIVTTP